MKGSSSRKQLQVPPEVGVIANGKDGVEVEEPDYVGQSAAVVAFFATTASRSNSPEANTVRKCREIRDEIKTEMDYFYHRILKKQMEKPT